MMGKYLKRENRRCKSTGCYGRNISEARQLAIGGALGAELRGGSLQGACAGESDVPR